MVKDIWALYYHKLSTDDDPHHGRLCPKGETSWWGYQNDVVGNKTYTQKSSVHIMDGVYKPVFKSLEDKDLLTKYLHGKTPNPNESVNSVICEKVSSLTQHWVCGYKKSTFWCLWCCVSSLNIGNVRKCMVFSKLSINIGKKTLLSMKKIDKCWILDSKRHSLDYKKIARQEKRQVKRRLEDMEEDPDEPSYGADMF